MTITLPREQQEWLEAQVAAGNYDSVDQAVASIVAEHMLLDIDDLSWTKPLIDEARESLARGEGMTLDEYRQNMDERLVALRRRSASKATRTLCLHVRTAVEYACRMIEPSSEALAELRVINEIVASRQFPVGVENHDVEFGEDAAGNAAVWIRLAVDEEHSNPSKEWISQVGEFVAKLQEELLDRHLRHWPYIELKAGSGSASQ